MKRLVKGGVTATLFWLLCSTAAPAANFPQISQNSTSTTPEIAPSSLEESKPTENGEEVRQAIASTLPADAPVVATINTKSEVWKSLGRFQYYQLVIKIASQYLPPDIKFDYAKDVESWLGEEVVLAYLPKIGDTKASIDSNFLVIAPIKDEKRLQPFLDKLQENPQEAKQRQYKGFTIIELETTISEPKLPSLPLPNVNSPRKIQVSSASKLDKAKPEKKSRTLAIATLPGYVAIGLNAKSIEQIIDVSQEGSPNLAQNPNYQQANQSPEGGQVLFKMYQNPFTFISLLQDISQDPKLPIPLSNAYTFKPEKLKEYNSINTLVFVQPEGLRFQINAYRQTPRENISELRPASDTILTRMPAATYSAATGRNLNQQWQILTTALSTEPELKKWLTQFRDFVRTSSGLDVDKDIISWMDGEYGFFLYPTKGGLFKMLGKVIGNDVNLGIGLAVETNNRDAAETSLKKLDEFVKSFSGGVVEVKTQTIKGQPITSWDVQGDSSQSLLAYSWVDEKTVVVTTGFGAIADLVPQPYILLPKTYNFTTATNSLPRPNYGYFYVNMGSSLSWAYAFIPREYNDNQYVRTFKELMGSVYSLSATSSVTDKREQFDFLVVLAPARKEN